MDTPLAPLAGLHHVTAIGRDAARNVDFYSRALGLRLVKRTVNFDDPGTYHLYYGDEVGHPGTILTFFPWPLAVAGTHGLGQATVTALRVPAGSLGWWRDRLRGLGVAAEEAPPLFEEERLRVLDPDGLELALVASPAAAGQPAWDAAVPGEHAVRTLDGVTLASARPAATAAVLDVLGFTAAGAAGDRQRFLAGGPGGARVDLLSGEGLGFGRIAAGAVHHVAWRVPDAATQLAWRDRLLELGLQVSPVMDRQYFQSIYFREPGGILFEIATDPPGFTRDETVAALGAELRLPPWLEPQRERIAAQLPSLAPAEVA